MISINDFAQCKIKGDTVGDLLNVLKELDPDTKLYFLKVCNDGSEIRDAYELIPTKSEISDGTEDGYTIVL